MTDWKTIDSAPRDGTLVRLRSAKFAPAEPFAWSHGRWETMVFGLTRTVTAWWDENAEQPTHWRAAHDPS